MLASCENDSEDLKGKVGKKKKKSLVKESLTIQSVVVRAGAWTSPKSVLEVQILGSHNRSVCVCVRTHVCARVCAQLCPTLL